MSAYLAGVPKPGLPRKRIIALIVAVQLAVLFVAGFYAAQPVSLSVDGRTITVPFGTTVADLGERGTFSAAYGDLIAVDGSIATTGGGEPPVVRRNGTYAGRETRLYQGDEIATTPGTDRREPLETVELPVPHGTRYEGEGPWLELATLGSPGLRVTTRGAVSGIETTSTIVQPPQDQLILRTRPRPDAKLVALTFDDGPTKGQTDVILDILKREEVRATFFMLGQRIKAEPALAKRVVAEGHLIGNHSYNHPKLTGLDNGAVVKQVVNTRKRIRAVAGTGTSWFRPPYGAVDGKTLKTLRDLDQHVVMWDVDPQDWRKPGASVIAKRVVSQTRPGSVILLHDGGGDRRKTIAALGGIIRELKKQGYVFVTVQEMAEYPRDKGSSNSTSPPDGYGP